MALAAAPQASHTLSLLGTPKSTRLNATTRSSSSHVSHVASSFRVHASSTSSSQAEGPSKRGTIPPTPEIDTRIHWENDDEGWIGGSSSKKTQKQVEQEQQKDVWGNKFADLLEDASDSHYQ